MLLAYNYSLHSKLKLAHRQEQSHKSIYNFSSNITCIPTYNTHI